MSEQPIPDFYAIEDDHRRYIACKVGEKQLRVRVPLQIFQNPSEATIEPYSKLLHKKVRAEYERIARGLRNFRRASSFRSGQADSQHKDGQDDGRSTVRENPSPQGG